MRRVIVESPFAAPTDEGIELHVRYLRACLVDCFRRGEAPFASHGLYTQPGVLRDDVPAERELGIAAGLLWGAAAVASVVYLDFGVSSGMEHGLRTAVRACRPIDLRQLTTEALERAIGIERTRIVRAKWIGEMAYVAAAQAIEDERRKLGG